MLGLSATMVRKDGLSNVFKMFLGEIVYSVKREKEDNVIVKAIEYSSNDEEFNEVKYDYKSKQYLAESWNTLTEAQQVYVGKCPDCWRGTVEYLEP